MNGVGPMYSEKLGGFVLAYTPHEISGGFENAHFEQQFSQFEKPKSVFNPTQAWSQFVIQNYVWYLQKG